jgi:hypothetical protein
MHLPSCQRPLHLPASVPALRKAACSAVPHTASREPTGHRRRMAWKASDQCGTAHMAHLHSRPPKMGSGSSRGKNVDPYAILE